jgi:type II secretory ATPase GspE/PulE/Tfp pilus assembly ATPase PilB-like protein
VFSTLHTNSAVGVVPRLVDMGVDPYLIAPTLILAMAQRLVRVNCPGPNQEVPIDGATKIMIDKQFEDLPEAFKRDLPINSGFVHEALPSEECPSGMRGRMAVFEMFEVDKELQNIILKNPVEQEIYKSVRAKGMITMREDAILKSIKGTVPFQEVHGL